MKHLPFQSIYRPDFEVVEQRHGKTTYYPHTDQLPALHRAIDLEFRGGLPGKLARVDRRADDYYKLALRTAGQFFCPLIHGARADNLVLYPLYDRDLVTRIAIVQQITEQTRRGPLHCFHFYAGPSFSTDIFLNGKRLLFSDHALERFSTRVPNSIASHLSELIHIIYGAPMISLPAGKGRAFIVPHGESILAFTYLESDTQFVITTCLTVNELNILEQEVPVRGHNLHYDLPFTIPLVRNWMPFAKAMDYFKRWQTKAPLPTREDFGRPHARWHKMGHYILDIQNQCGWGPGSKLVFQDRIPGPLALEIRAKEVEGQFNELQTYKEAHPQHDWDKIFAEVFGAPYLLPSKPPVSEDPPAQAAA
jgi:hypothetical protein